MADSKRAKPGDPQKVEQVRDAKGNLLGYKTTKPNSSGVTQAWDKKGTSLGWSKDAKGGGLPGTFKFGGSKKTGPSASHRVTHGENLDILFGDQD